MVRCALFTQIDKDWVEADNANMAAVISAPKSWVASVGRLSLPKKTERRLHALMERNNDGQLTATERRELAALVEWSENVSLIRAEALKLLGRQPA
ncbi:hypothetical protein EI77_01984 [Prosthecobacter fusiformis]|uniref:Uncharacterized protein n=2 Tax=Prosthecobacter fusiformis TaxID=48464 RepID=A0A4R7S0A8_9BACT|nr:hypothetical protein EI77_01984 [Prosthecobacter fusiformis]